MACSLIERLWAILDGFGRFLDSLIDQVQINQVIC
jgi:hypothetical protein